MNIIIGLFILSFIIIIHELGHLLAAVSLKIKVKEFRLFFGPKLLTTNIRGTSFSLGCIPLGGYVKFDNGDINEHFHTGRIETDATSPYFFSTSISKKIIIILAGPASNILFYFLCSWILFYTGTTLITYSNTVVVQDTLAEQNAPAKIAGLRTGDTITAINQIPVNNFDDIIRIIKNSQGSLTVTFARAGLSKTAEILPYTTQEGTRLIGLSPFIPPVIGEIGRKSPFKAAPIAVGDTITGVNGLSVAHADQFYKYVKGQETLTIQYQNKEGPQETTVQITQDNRRSATEESSIVDSLGILFEYVVVRTRPQSYLQYMNSVFLRVGNTVVATFGAIFSAYVHPSQFVSDVSGPIGIVGGIARTTQRSLASGGLSGVLIALLNLTAAINLSLAIVNLVPLPILDGGQMLFYLVAHLRKKGYTVKGLAMYNGIGALLLLFIFILVMYGDILRL